MKKSLLILMAGCLALFACNKQENPSAAGDGLVPIEFTLGESSFEAVVSTRATEITNANAATTLQSLYFTATTGTNNTAVSSLANVSFTRQSNGTYKAADKYWPATDPSYHFYAANASISNSGGNVTVSPANGNTDVVVGYLETTNYKGSNAITLNHVFAQIGTITINAPSGYTVTDLKIYFRPVTSGTYNLKTSDWTSRGSAASSDTYLVGSSSSGLSITTAGGSTNVADLNMMVVPLATGTNYTLTASYKIHKNGYDSDTITGTSNVYFQKGMQNNITANLTEGTGAAQDITFTVDVTGWGDNPITATF